MVQWTELPEWVPDELIANGVGATDDLRSGIWPISEEFALALEAAVGREFIRRRRVFRRLDYYIEYVADD